MNDLVCTSCGIEAGKCEHTHETDYCVEPRADYEAELKVVQITLAGTAVITLAVLGYIFL